MSPAPGYMYCHRRLGHKYTSEHMEGVKEVSDVLFLMIDSSVKLKFFWYGNLLFSVGKIVQQISFPSTFFNTYRACNGAYKLIALKNTESSL